jgi:hypothetical protein
VSSASTVLDITPDRTARRLGRHRPADGVHTYSRWRSLKN